MGTGFSLNAELLGGTLLTMLLMNGESSNQARFDKMSKSREGGGTGGIIPILP